MCGFAEEFFSQVVGVVVDELEVFERSALDEWLDAVFWDEVAEDEAAVFYVVALEHDEAFTEGCIHFVDDDHGFLR